MGERRRRAADRALRPAMRSPGRPTGWRREHRQRFWEAIARGLSSEEAALEVGLSSGEREELAILHAQEFGVREIARRLSRSPSTISRELRRNAATRGGGFEYRATTAQWPP